MLDREQDKLINESLFGRAKDTGLDVAKHLNVADQLYQALSTEKDPSQITDDDIDNLVLAWTSDQEWLPAEFAPGLIEYLGQYLKNRRNDTVSDAGDAYGRSSTELPFSR